MPLFFLLAKSLFGLNPLGYHLMSFGIFFILVFCIFQLFKLLIGDRRIAIIASFLYAVWSIHFISLSWLSTTSYIIGPLFQALSFTFFIKFVQGKRTLLLLASFIMFLFGLASSEFTLVLPIIFLAWGLLVKKENHLKKILPFLFIVSIYIFLRFVLFLIPAKADYQLYFNKQIINNFLWYLAWAFGLPESFKSLIFPSLPDQSIKVITQFWQITIPFVLLILLIAKLFFATLRENLQYHFFGLAWISIGLLPVIFTINHSYPVYLSFAGLGFLYSIMIALRSSKNHLWLPLIILLWIVINYTNLQFTRATHWIKNEQAISRAYMVSVKKHIQNPSSESIFLFRPADLNFSKKNDFILVETEDTLRQSLNNQDAIQVLYNDSSLQSIFAKDQDKPDLPKGKQVFEIIPKLNK